MGKEDLTTRKILDNIRGLQEGKTITKNLLTEEDEKERDAIAITDDPKFGDKVLTNQIEQFRMSVDGGAEFAKPSMKVADCPLIYMPSTGNLIFSGTIPRLNNLKFQFVLRTNTGNGCFVWADGLILSEENMRTIEKLFGFWKNWSDSWNTQSADLEMLGNMIDEQ